jgi:hypothetical protein
VNACAIFGRGRALKLSRGLYSTALSVTITEANLCRELAAADKRGRSRLVSAFGSIFFGHMQRSPARFEAARCAPTARPGSSARTLRHQAAPARSTSRSMPAGIPHPRLKTRTLVASPITARRQ